MLRHLPLLALAAACLASGSGSALAFSDWDACMDRCMSDKGCSTTEEGDNYCQVSHGECYAQCDSANSSSAPRGSFGALAYSPGTGATGWSYDWADPASAERNALQGCAASAADCVITQTFHDLCAAVVDGDNHDGPASAVGATLAEAEAIALGGCQQRGGQNCKVEGETCSPR